MNFFIQLTAKIVLVAFFVTNLFWSIPNPSLASSDRYTVQKTEPELSRENPQGAQDFIKALANRIEEKDRIDLRSLGRPKKVDREAKGESLGRDQKITEVSVPESKPAVQLPHFNFLRRGVVFGLLFASILGATGCSSSGDDGSSSWLRYVDPNSSYQPLTVLPDHPTVVGGEVADPNNSSSYSVTQSSSTRFQLSYALGNLEDSVFSYIKYWTPQDIGSSATFDIRGPTGTELKVQFKDVSGASTDFYVRLTGAVGNYTFSGIPQPVGEVVFVAEQKRMGSTAGTVEVDTRGLGYNGEVLVDPNTTAQPLTVLPSAPDVFSGQSADSSSTMVQPAADEFYFDFNLSPIGYAWAAAVFPTVQTMTAPLTLDIEGPAGQFAKVEIEDNWNTHSAIFYVTLTGARANYTFSGFPSDVKAIVTVAEGAHTGQTGRLSVWASGIPLPPAAPIVAQSLGKEVEPLSLEALESTALASLQENPVVVIASLTELNQLVGGKRHEDLVKLLGGDYIKLIISDCLDISALPKVFREIPNISQKAIPVAGTLTGESLLKLRSVQDVVKGIGQRKIVHISDIEPNKTGIEKIMSVKTGFLRAAVVSASGDPTYLNAFVQDKATGFWVPTELGQRLMELMQEFLGAKVVAQAA